MQKRVIIISQYAILIWLSLLIDVDSEYVAHTFWLNSRYYIVWSLTLLYLFESTKQNEPEFIRAALRWIIYPHMGYWPISV